MICHTLDKTCTFKLPEQYQTKLGTMIEIVLHKSIYFTTDLPSVSEAGVATPGGGGEDADPRRPTRLRADDLRLS